MDEAGQYRFVENVENGVKTHLTQSRESNKFPLLKSDSMTHKSDFNVVLFKPSTIIHYRNLLTFRQDTCPSSNSACPSKCMNDEGRIKQFTSAAKSFLHAASSFHDSFCFLSLYFDIFFYIRCLSDRMEAA